MLQYIEFTYPSPPLIAKYVAHKLSLQIVLSIEKNKKEWTETLVIFHEAVGALANACKPVLVHLLNSTTEVCNYSQLKKNNNF